MSFLIKDGKVLMTDGKPISAEVSGDSLKLLADAVENTNKIISESYVGGTATYKDLIEGKTAYVKGEKIEGTIKVYNGETSAELKSTSDTKTFYTKGKYLEENITVSTPTKETETEDNPVYTYFKNIFDNTNIEDYPLKLMCVYSGEYARTSSGSILENTRYFTVNSNIVLNVNGSTKNLTSQTSLTDMGCSTYEGAYPFKVFDSMLNNEIEFGYIMLHFKLWNDISSILKLHSGHAAFSMFAHYPIYYFSSDEISFREVLLSLGSTAGFGSQSLRKIPIVEDDHEVYKTLNLSSNNEQPTITSKTLLIRYSDVPIHAYDCKNLLLDIKTSETATIYTNSTKLEKIESIQKVDIGRLSFPQYSNAIIKEIINFKYSSIGYIFTGRDFVPLYLKELRLYDITTNCCIGYKLKSKDLSYESIIHTISQLITQTSKRTLTIGTYNLAKISDVYVKELEITQEMYEEDNKVYDKRPFYVCDSTEEGAMSITDYVALKNWSLA